MTDIKFDLLVKNKNTGYINHKYYFLRELMCGVKTLFDVENYDILAKRQFTGLKDRSGKDIYEGDILKLDGDIVAPITFEDGSFQLIAIRTQGRSPFIQERAKRYEITGNVYETPELLIEAIK